MNNLQHSRGLLPRLFSIARGWRNSRDAASGISAGPVVRLVDTPRRQAENEIELQIISILQKAGAVSHDQLVQRVARDLYEGELRRGAAVVDIGMFGSRLFEPEVARSLRAGDGTIWEIV